MKLQGRSYGTKEEYEMRKTLFAGIDREIINWNADKSKTHQLAHN